jgi:transglutaminase-like putative cysteine protease
VTPDASPGDSTAPAPQWLLTLAEVSLAGLTAAGVVGLARLFSDISFLLPVLAFALAGHALAAACRRRGIPAGITAALAVAGLIAGVSIFLLPETTLAGIPTGATLDQAGRELGEALAAFREVVAPAPVQPGFVLAAAVAAWVVAFVADAAAFRARARVEAAVPAATLFVFGAALGAPPQRIPVTALFLAVLIAYWLTQRLLVQASAPQRMGPTDHTGTGPLLRAGALLGALAVIAAIVVGPFLPGAEASAVIPWRAGDRDGPGSRVTISPLVDIRSRIVDQSDVEVFTVASDARSYWRLTSLESFDGRIWSSRGQYAEVDGGLPGGIGDDQASADRVVQDFEIEGLASIWLPTAYRPVGLEGINARFDDDSASLLTEEESAAGLAYRVTSAVPTLDQAALTGATEGAPGEVAETYTTLPVDFSDEVRAEAARITEGAATPYEQARRLQDSFRDGTFTYDLSVAPGHSGDDLEGFLFETRRGYCEQFAGAFAAMARSIGLPARVAVGFTPGEVNAEGRFVVRGLNAHAWPEVFLAGYGWVAFEPTPGRGMPGAESYTGIPEQQATPGDPTTATTRPSTEAATPTTGGAQGTPTTQPGAGQAERRAG